MVRIEPAVQIDKLKHVQNPQRYQPIPLHWQLNVGQE
jgi:hypothetical protein